MKTLISRAILLLGLAVAAAAEAVPTLSVAPTSSCAGCSVTATWSGIVAPTGTDWIAMYAPGAPNTSYITWIYTGGGASGSVALSVPGGVAVGTYELRLLYNNGYTVLATSNSFTVNPTVSGTVTSGGSALASVTVTGTNGATCGQTNASGVYSCAVPYNWTGTLTPSLPGYLFTPASRNHSNVTANVGSQNFTAASAPQVTGTVSVSGSPLTGVAIAGSNGAICTTSNASGQYSCTVPTSWSGSVTPSLAGYSFAPASRSYSGVTVNDSGENYAATVVHQLSGTITVGGSPLGSVAVAASNGGACTASNGSGQYTCTVPQGWSGTVTPSLIHNSFSPASRSYTNVTAAQSSQNYAASVVYQMSGSVTLNGLPLADVAIAATNGVTCAPSNAIGQYNCTVPAGWSGTVTPSATGYSFSPVSRNFSSIGGDQASQGFAATLDTATAPLYFVHVDHLNTPRMIYDANQQIRWKWDHAEPFGNIAPDENPTMLGALEFPLRFSGQYADGETNLAYNYFRDYDPGTGTFKQSDLIGLEGGVNTYAYVEGDPLSDDDATGLAGERKSAPPVASPQARRIPNAGPTTTPQGGIVVQLPPPARCAVCGQQGSAPRPVAKVAGPDFPSVRTHAQRHAGDASVNQYYNAAVSNIQTGRRFNYRRGGEQRVCYLTPVGPDDYLFTATNQSGSVILTSYTMTSGQLRNIGITLPSGFCFGCQ